MAQIAPEKGANINGGNKSTDTPPGTGAGIVSNDVGAAQVKPVPGAGPPEAKPPPPQYLLDMLAAAKAERKAVRAERRLKRALEEKRAKKAAHRVERKKAVRDAKLGLPPDLNDSNIWLFEQMDHLYEIWEKSKARARYNKYLHGYKHNRYLVKRRITRIRYLTKKYYRRYLSISPAVRQRRQLNRDFKYVPKTNLALSYQMNLDQLMYCNIFDRERSRFQTIRDREALIKILKMPCVQGVASEVAFLLKADTDYIVDFVFRNHAFQETTTHSFRVTKRTLLPALQNSALDFRLFYHKCRIPAPPNKHPPLYKLVYDKLFKAKDEDIDVNTDEQDTQNVRSPSITGGDGEKVNEENEGDNEEDKGEEEGVKEGEGEESSKKNEEEDSDEDRSLESSIKSGGDDGSLDGSIQSNQETTTNEQDDKIDDKIDDKAEEGEEEEGKRDYDEIPMVLKKAKKKDGENDDEDDDDVESVMSDSSEQVALKMAKLLAQSAVSDYYDVIRTWFLEGEEIKHEKIPPIWKQALSYMYRVITRQNAKISPEEEEEGEDNGDGDGILNKVEEVDEEEEDEEEKEKREKLRIRKEKRIKLLIRIKKAVLCRNEYKESLKLHEKQVKEFRESEKKRKEEENYCWFEDPSHTLFERNEMRINGPNRHLSDLSDSTVIRPSMKPFPTTIDNATSCASYFYNEEDSNLDSVD